MSRFLTKKVSPASRWNPKGAMNVRSSNPRKLYSTFADQFGAMAIERRSFAGKKFSGALLARRVGALTVAQDPVIARNYTYRGVGFCVLSVIPAPAALKVTPAAGASLWA